MSANLQDRTLIEAQLKGLIEVWTPMCSYGFTAVFYKNWRRPNVFTLHDFATGESKEYKGMSK